MKLGDIAKVRINWMEQYANDPDITFILKRDRLIAPLSDFRFQQSGQLFFAEHENQVRFYYHDRTDHNGYGWACVPLRMVDGYDPAANGWRDCCSRQPDWGPGVGHSRLADCHYDHDTNTTHLIGPWSSNEMQVKSVFGVDCISVATLEGPSRNAVRNPSHYQRMRRRGQYYDGTALGTSYLLDFVREVIDTLAPHVELWQGDFGWTVKRRGMEPKNPRRRESFPAGQFVDSASCQQIAAFSK